MEVYRSIAAKWLEHKNVLNKKPFNDVRCSVQCQIKFYYWDLSTQYGITTKKVIALKAIRLLDLGKACIFVPLFYAPP